MVKSARLFCFSFYKAFLFWPCEIARAEGTRVERVLLREVGVRVKPHMLGSVGPEGGSTRGRSP